MHILVVWENWFKKLILRRILPRSVMVAVGEGKAEGRQRRNSEQGEEDEQQDEVKGD